MNILLIEAFEVGDNPLTPDWLMQPLGLMTLGAVLREKGWNNIKIFDTKLSKNPTEELKEIIHTFKPKLAGVRSYSSSADFFTHLLGIIKSQDPGIVTVAGGPHANTMPSNIIKDKNLDYIVLNEGEITLPLLLKALEKGEPVDNIEGIVFKKGEEVVVTKPRPFIEDLDGIPFPAWDLIDHTPYSYRFLDNSPYRINYVQVRQNSMPMFTSRACPFNCIYCHKIFGKRFRAQSPERVLKEIDTLYEEFNIRQFDFYDDIFNMDKNRALSILKGIAHRRQAGKDIKLSFFNGIRGDILDGLTVKAFKDAGTFMIPYAVETASPRLQKLIKKNIKLDKLKRIIDLTSKMNIITVGFAMLGFPTETQEEVQATIDFMLTSGFDTMEFFLVSPYHGTELAEMIKKEYPQLSKADMENVHFLKANFSLSQLSPETLKELHRDAYFSLFKDRARQSRLLYKIDYHRSR